ncbi:hypothetical protein FJQ98_17915 [Lysinibacillus agricola]|uniref:Uncharacterized protein n=1 Tax=Lysinibacillus agricola TaxID=2590012 RepID=A0ABX7AMF0_9BACI|nr:MULTISPECIES: hypothetical protein [Lysinibacillus]QQP11100.1 hypothetical protein FJQ98_17915 [Lysinibacillus agricola]
MEAGRLLGISVTDKTLERSGCFLCESGNEAAHRTPPGSSALRESVATATTNVSVAKAKRQLQSAQSERKATTRYGDVSMFVVK